MDIIYTDEFLLDELTKFVNSDRGGKISDFKLYNFARIRFGTTRKALEKANLWNLYNEKKTQSRSKSTSKEVLLKDLKNFVEKNSGESISKFEGYQKIYHHFGGMKQALKILGLEKALPYGNEKYTDEWLSRDIRYYYIQKIFNEQTEGKKRTLWLHRFKKQKLAVDFARANALYLIAKISQILFKEIKEQEHNFSDQEKRFFLEMMKNLQIFVIKNFKEAKEIGEK